jgi:hypothetical protein
MARPARVRKEGASTSMRLRLKRPMSTTNLKYMMPEAVSIAPDTRRACFSPAAPLARTTVVTVEE